MGAETGGDLRRRGSLEFVNMFKSVLHNLVQTKIRNVCPQLPRPGKILVRSCVCYVCVMCVLIFVYILNSDERIFVGAFRSVVECSLLSAEKKTSPGQSLRRSFLTTSQLVSPWGTISNGIANVSVGVASTPTHFGSRAVGLTFLGKNSWQVSSR